MNLQTSQDTAGYQPDPEGFCEKTDCGKGKDTKYGARPLRRAMQTELEDKLAEAILNGEVKPGEQIEAGVSGKEIKFYLKNAN